MEQPLIWLSDMMYNYDKRKNYDIDKIKKGGVIMAHVAKYTQAQTGHLFNHYNRDKEKDCNRSNQDIDKSKTHENYNLMQREETPQEYFKSRLNQLYKIDRTDVKVMCDWVVTLPKDFNGSPREFFTHVTDFLNTRYGAENCIGAFVHEDEKQPHLHYSFIPVSKDENPAHEQAEKVCAKEVLTRKDLRTFHDDLQEHLRERMPDRNINVVTGITKEQGRNMTTKELKLQTQLERVNKKERELNECQQRLNQKEERLKTKQRDNLKRQKELDKEKSILEQREKGIKSKEKDLSDREQDIDREIQRQKGFRDYLQYKANYCADRGITEAQYERECFQANLTGNLKPYPEIANPALSKEERKEIRNGYIEHQKEQEHTQERAVPSR